MTVKSKLIALLTVGIILPVLIISVVIVGNIRTNALEDFKKDSQKEIQYVDTIFSMFLNNLAENVAFFARADVLTNLTPGSIKSYANAPSQMMRPNENSAKEQAAFELMNDFGKTHPSLSYIWLGSNDSGYLQWPMGMTENYDPLKKGWYQQSIDSKKPIRIPSYLDTTTKAPLVDYLQRFEGKDGFYGSVGVDVTLAELTEMLAKVKFGGEGYVVMVEDTGTILADPSNPENNFKNIEDASRPYSSLTTSDDIQEVTMDGATWFAKVYVSPELDWKFIGLVPSRAVFANANDLTIKIALIAAVIAVVMIGIFIVIGSALSNALVQPVKLMAKNLEELGQGKGDLTHRLEVNEKDESAPMAVAFNQLVSAIDVIIGHTKSSCGKIGKVVNQSESLSSELGVIVSNQVTSVDTMSSAFNNMIATADEVASNCNTAELAAENSETQVQEGNRLIKQTMESLNELETEINDSNETMLILAKESESIVGILDTIKAIADQTNLLALNAAIEAARAGEQGRGFAVVADEVRTLAGRTAESTDEIDKMLTKLQQQTGAASNKMNNSVVVAKSSVDLASQTYEVFEKILLSVLDIKNMMTQISASAEEQHLVAEEVKNSVAVIHEGTTKSDDLSNQVSQTAATLNTLSRELESMVSRFKSSS